MKRDASKVDPWFKFYPSNWRGEPSLRAVSMAARGLWIEMLCLMHEAQPRGHLLLNGRPVTDAQLATLAGVPVETAQALLGELETAGTFSRTRGGVIYSRRMRSDTATSDLQRDRVNARWEKERQKRDAQDSDDKEKTASGNTGHDTERLPKKPEARRSSEANASGATAEGPDAEAWRRAVAVLISVGRLSEKSARAFFGKLLKDTRLQPRDLLLVVVKTELQGTADPQGYMSAAAKAIASRMQAAEKKSTGDVVSWDDDTWRWAVRQWRENPNNWGERMGPKPGEPGCLVPSHLLIESAA